jgi:hypothetical protein
MPEESPPQSAQNNNHVYEYTGIDNSAEALNVLTEFYIKNPPQFDTPPIFSAFVSAPKENIGFRDDLINLLNSACRNVQASILQGREDQKFIDCKGDIICIKDKQQPLGEPPECPSFSIDINPNQDADKKYKIPAPSQSGITLHHDKKSISDLTLYNTLKAAFPKIKIQAGSYIPPDIKNVNPKPETNFYWIEIGNGSLNK